MPKISFNLTRCAGDRLCTFICPMRILAFDEEKKRPFLIPEKAETCIACGHCEAICPHDAVSLTPEQHTPAKQSLPTLIPNEAQIKQLILGRRSIRTYKENSVDHATITEIIETARYAPTAKNTQLINWLVIDDKNEIEILRSEVIHWVEKEDTKNDTQGKRVDFANIIQSWKNGNDPIFRRAPGLVLTYAPTSYPMGFLDSTIAMATFELAAYAKGLGTCWAGYFMAATKQWKPLQERLALPDGFTMTCALMVGYPKFHFSHIPSRKKPDISWR